MEIKVITATDTVAASTGAGVVSTDAGTVTTVSVSDTAFGAAFNEPLVHRAVVAWLAGARSGNRAQKSRSAVSGGGRKPWRQKGTGRARAGTIRSPIWRGGGRTFAASQKDFSQKLNRREYGAALRSIVSELLRQERLLVTAEWGVTKPATGALRRRLDGLGVGAALLLSHGPDLNLELSARNLPNVDVATAAEVSPVQLVFYDKVVTTVDAIKALEARLQ